MSQNGYKILKRNHRTKIGEIDIVAQEGNILCFIEVKSRLERSPAGAWEAVGRSKQKKLTALALEFSQIFKIRDLNMRFDVVAVYQNAEGKFHCEVLKNAFDAAF